MNDKKLLKKPTYSKKKKTDLAEKRAANLRANLKKRKALIRERKEN